MYDNFDNNDVNSTKYVHLPANYNSKNCIPIECTSIIDDNPLQTIQLFATDYTN